MPTLPLTPPSSKAAPRTPPKSGEKRKRDLNDDGDEYEEAVLESPTAKSGKKTSTLFAKEIKSKLAIHIIEKGIASMSIQDWQELSAEVGKDVRQVKDQFQKNRKNILSALTDKAQSL